MAIGQNRHLEKQSSELHRPYLKASMMVLDQSVTHVVKVTALPGGHEHERKSFYVVPAACQQDG
jgi:hypothetical protein